MTPSPLAQSPPWRRTDQGSLGSVAPPPVMCSFGMLKHDRTKVHFIGTRLRPPQTKHPGKTNTNAPLRSRRSVRVSRPRVPRNVSVFPVGDVTSNENVNITKLLLSRFISIPVSFVAAPTCHHMGALLPGVSRFIRGPTPKYRFVLVAHT